VFRSKGEQSICRENKISYKISECNTKARTSSTVFLGADSWMDRRMAVELICGALLLLGFGMNRMEQE
jgi:hypothetical protein